MCPRAARRFARRLPLAAALLAACGCGGGLHPVRGKVLQHGAPVKGAVVVFHPAGDDGLTARRPSGVTDEQGEFTLTTTKPGDGAAAGDYVVTIIWPEEAKPTKAMSTEGPPEAADRLKGKYADRAKSGLSAQVKPGRNEVPPFNVE